MDPHCGIVFKSHIAVRQANMPNCPSGPEDLVFTQSRVNAGLGPHIYGLFVLGVRSLPCALSK